MCIATWMELGGPGPARPHCPAVGRYITSYTKERLGPSSSWGADTEIGHTTSGTLSLATNPHTLLRRTQSCFSGSYGESHFSFHHQTMGFFTGAVGGGACSTAKASHKACLYARVCAMCFGECACPGDAGGAVMGVGWKRAVGWVSPSLALCHKWFLIRCIIACGCELSLPSAVSNRWKIKRASTQAIFGIRFVLIRWRRTSEAINTPKRRGCERKMERLDGWIHSELGVLPARPTDRSCSFALQRFELLFKGVVHFYHSFFLTLNPSALEKNLVGQTDSSTPNSHHNVTF